MNTSKDPRARRRVVALLLASHLADPCFAQEPSRQQPRAPATRVAVRDEQADAHLVNLALLNADDDTREDAVRRLSELPRLLALPALQQALLDLRAAVRAAATDAVADLDGEVVEGMLAGALVDPSPDVREEAVYSFGRVGGPLARDAVRLALADPDPSVREAAALVLRELTGERRSRPPRRRPK